MRNAVAMVSRRGTHKNTEYGRLENAWFRHSNENVNHHEDNSSKFIMTFHLVSMSLMYKDNVLVRNLVLKFYSIIKSSLF